MDPHPFLQPPDPNVIAAGDIVGGKYHLPHPHTMKPHAWARTTSFVEKIADTWALHQWEKQTIIAGLALQEDLYAEACGSLEFTGKTYALSRSAKESFNDIASRAKEAAGGNTGARLGTALHSFVERAKRGEPHGAPKNLAHKVDLYLDALRAHCLIPQTNLLERKVVSLRYNLAGTFDDCFLSPEFGLVVGDTKTQKRFYSYSSAAMQLALYANADYMWNADTQTYEDMPAFNKDVGLLVWLPINEDICDVRWVDIAQGLKALDLAQAVYEWQKAGRRNDEVGGVYVPRRRAVVERYGRLLASCEGAHELDRVRDEACSFAYWCPELEEVFVARVSSLAQRDRDLVSTVDIVSTVD